MCKRKRLKTNITTFKIQVQYVLVGKLNFKPYLFFGQNLESSRKLSKMHEKEMCQKRTRN